MDADKQVQQAKEDEHADHAEIEVVMRDIEHVFVLQYEQDGRNETRFRRPSTSSIYLSADTWRQIY